MGFSHTRNNNNDEIIAQRKGMMLSVYVKHARKPHLFQFVHKHKMILICSRLRLICKFLFIEFLISIAFLVFSNQMNEERL